MRLLSLEALPMSPTTVNEHLLTASDVARQLGVAQRTVQYWADIGRLPGFKLGRAWRFWQKDIDNFVRRHET